jgi:hypothetical protein
MKIIVVEQTANKLVLKVKDSSIVKGLSFCLLGVATSYWGSLATITSIKFLLSGSSSTYSLIDIVTFIAFLKIFLLGISWLYRSIAFFGDTRWTFDKDSRKLFVKNSKFLIASPLPCKYSFDKIKSVKTNLKTITTSMGPTITMQIYRKYKVYRLSILLKSNKEMIISTDKKTPINQERQSEIANLIRSYLT